MNNTTQIRDVNSTQLNDDNLLIRSDGTYNYEIHSKLSQIIKNMATKYHATNNSLSVDDLIQDAWVKVFETIRQSPKEISYLVIVAKNAILAQCMSQTSKNKSIDDFNSMLLSSMDNTIEKGTHVKLNVAKQRLEYTILRDKTQEDDAVALKVSLEQILENLDNERVKTIIIIQYIKQFNGESDKIQDMYKQLYNSLDSDKKAILDNMDKFTYNDAYRVLGLRATDNCTSRIRHRMKEVLSVLR